MPIRALSGWVRACLHTGQLSDEAIERTVKALRVCSNKLKWWNVGVPG